MFLLVSRALRIVWSSPTGPPSLGHSPPPRFTSTWSLLVLSLCLPAKDEPFILDGRCTATRVSRAATHTKLEFVFLRPGQARLWVGRQITRIKICGRPPFARAAPRPGDRQRHGTQTRPRLLKSQREGAQLTPMKSEYSPIQNSPSYKRVTQARQTMTLLC